ncbi:hypothetical protein [Rhizobium leguminosarum]|uniref:hypothetical protein n=1 Tax=Rhizobium leguminosarum TaxID=384 RepID=UPI001C9691C1|nr:hypothetical protein [Rhizobium leguminosarum]MBY5560559.1 hypothetical protein [Rhizobium leguminosarum]MBY5708919.1 hypothetical protein [Rhizobium leguminosarum]
MRDWILPSRSIPAAVLLCLVGAEAPAPVAQAAEQITDFCRTRVDRADALDNPSRHAWNLFMNLMHPAKDPAVERGMPDCSKKIGTPGTTAVFETWRLARTEVFLANGAEPPVWEDLTLPSGELGTTPEEAKVVSAHEVEPPAAISFDDEEGQSIFAGRGGIGETRMNRSTYDFIRNNCLYSLDGLKRYSKAVLEGHKPPINFPVDSIETKSVWLEFTPEAVARGDHVNYYNITKDGKTYGLTSFHILTKDVPNWFWATFHHKNAPPNKFERPDTYGQPTDLAGTVWGNYVLGGTQIDFTEPTGKPVPLSDHFIEFRFQNSSCITCHAMAHGSPDGVNGQNFDDPNGAIQTIETGLPDFRKFEKDGKPFYVQTDFLWSIPFRARSEVDPPPSRCKS